MAYGNTTKDAMRSMRLHPVADPVRDALFRDVFRPRCLDLLAGLAEVAFSREIEERRTKPDPLLAVEAAAGDSLNSAWRPPLRLKAAGNMEARRKAASKHFFGQAMHAQSVGSLREDLLEGVHLPAPDRQWLWPVAPFGEYARDEELVHRVHAYLDFRAARRRG